jgi:hypothetical protein
VSDVSASASNPAILMMLSGRSLADVGTVSVTRTRRSGSAARRDWGGADEQPVGRGDAQLWPASTIEQRGRRGFNGSGPGDHVVDGQGSSISDVADQIDRVHGFSAQPRLPDDCDREIQRGRVALGELDGAEVGSDDDGIVVAERVERGCEDRN